MPMNVFNNHPAHCCRIKDGGGLPHWADMGCHREFAGCAFASSKSSTCRAVLLLASYARIVPRAISSRSSALRKDLLHASISVHDFQLTRFASRALLPFNKARIASPANRCKLTLNNNNQICVHFASSSIGTKELSLLESIRRSQDNNCAVALCPVKHWYRATRRLSCEDQQIVDIRIYSPIKIQLARRPPLRHSTFNRDQLNAWANTASYQWMNHPQSIY